MKKILICLVLVGLAFAGGSCSDSDSSDSNYCPPKLYHPTPKPCPLPLPPPPPPPPPQNRRKFQLTFKYACRQRISFGSCKGFVFWNGKKVASIAPKDYKVHKYSVWVYVNAGQNSLKFQGAGCSDSYGLTIDNVRLVRYGTKVNIVVNGGFQRPNVGKGWKIFNDIPGWWGKGFEVGSSHLYNCRWGKTQVVELDGHKNAFLVQKWKFNSQYNLITNQNNVRKYRLSFQYACRQNIAFGSCKGNVFWNGKHVLSINPHDYNVKTKVIDVYAKVGQNMLKFAGAGCSDSFGLTIDNVRLVRYGEKRNIVVNGGFERPCVGRGWKIFNDIPGWWGSGFEVGSAHLYNCKWGKTQVVELDGHRNAHLTQKWNFNKHFHC